MGATHLILIGTLAVVGELQPRVVCGMVIVPVKPEADPKMVVRSKSDPQVDYKIRTIAPRMCNE